MSYLINLKSNIFHFILKKLFTPPFLNFRHSSHIDFNFPFKQGLGTTKFLGHVTVDCQDLITKLLAYNPEERYSAKQALSHPYFKDLVEQEIKLSKMSSINFNKGPQNLMLSFNNDSMSFIKGYDIL